MPVYLSNYLLFTCPVAVETYQVSGAVKSVPVRSVPSWYYTWHCSVLCCMFIDCNCKSTKSHRIQMFSMNRYILFKHCVNMRYIAVVPRGGQEGSLRGSQEEALIAALTRVTLKYEDRGGGGGGGGGWVLNEIYSIYKRTLS